MIIFPRRERRDLFQTILSISPISELSEIPESVSDSFKSRMILCYRSLDCAWLEGEQGGVPGLQDVLDDVPPGQRQVGQVHLRHQVRQEQLTATHHDIFPVGFK